MLIVVCWKKAIIRLINHIMRSILLSQWWSVAEAVPTVEVVSPLLHPGVAPRLEPLLLHLLEHAQILGLQSLDLLALLLVLLDKEIKLLHPQQVILD